MSRGRIRLWRALGIVVGLAFLVALGVAVARSTTAARTTTATEPGSATVVDDLFVHLDRLADWDGSLVVRSADPQRALVAMESAVPRFAALAITADVGVPRIDGTAVDLHLGTRRAVTGRDRRAILQIISAALGRQGIRSARVTAPSS